MMMMHKNCVKMRGQAGTGWGKYRSSKSRDTAIQVHYSTSQQCHQVNTVQVLNYAAIGFTIGHELTHAFDDNGRKYDGEVTKVWVRGTEVL